MTKYPMTKELTFRRLVIGCLVIGYFHAVVFQPALAQEGSLVTYRSKRFVVRTDLSQAQADAALTRLEQLVDQLEAYWGKPTKGPIEVRLVGKLDRWSPNELPADATEQLKQNAGTTLTERATDEDGNVVSIESIVYATPDPRSYLHEAVHAYCWQTFGRCGPDWYAEGMAELWAFRMSGVSEKFAAFLRENPPVTIADVVGDKLPTKTRWQAYAYRWALCQLLASDQRYAQQFQTFGRKLLNGENVDPLAEFAVELPSLEAGFAAFMRETQASRKR
jgi:hypothetical protein